MASQRLDKLASQFNYDLCISDSLNKFNNLVNGISNDYTKYLDLYKEELIKLKVDPQNYQQFDSILRTTELEKKYQQLINIIKIGFSNEI